MKPLQLGPEMSMNLLKLIDTRMLINANSGGGKSWLLRLLIEQAAPQMQVIVIDPEGEFSTLREKLDILLAGREGEVPVTVKTAPVLARRLLELKVSAVIDIYELKLHERRAFIKQFIDAFMSAPRSLWGPCIIAIDEAHLYCPERSAGEAESTNSVIALMSQGRKRGFCGILATQRISKLHKDAAAETNNVCIGRTWLDVDQKRAGELLGMDKEGRQELRKLTEGYFFGFGPAFDPPEVTRWQSGKPITTHPAAGSRHKMKAPTTPQAIQKLIPGLRESLEDPTAGVFDLESAQRQVKFLERQLAEAKKQKPDPEAGKRLADAEKSHQKVNATLNKVIKSQADQALEAHKLMCRATRLLENISQAKVEDIPPPYEPVVPTRAMKAIVRNLVAPTPAQQPSVSTTDKPLGKAERSILQVLAQYPEGRSKIQIAIMCAYAHGGGGFNNSLSSLKSKGYITGSQSEFRITEVGIAAAGPVDPLPTGDELAQHWYQHPRIGKAERSILEALISVYPNGLTKEALAEATNYIAGGGGFNNAISKLRTLDLISGRGAQELKASEVFFS